ncbi:hypothetical protein U1839_14195 [Sphingomonas sp. RT2P30]|uniref:hypothetical protein n=1 Tax=Parasphingomonas halimpatiens TaxID=3096162 RepID=UPI002FC727C9
MMQRAALSRSADRSPTPLPAGMGGHGPARARLGAVAGQLNEGKAVQRLAALGRQVAREGASPAAAPSGEVVQRLMTADVFTKQRGAVKSKKLDAIATLLTTYASAWGYSIGLGEYDGAHYRQERLRLLNDLEHQIHAYFRDSGKARIDDAPASGVMLSLLNDVQAEHEKQIATLASHPDELPVDDRKLSPKAKGEVLGNWQSIVGGTGNLRITDVQHDKGTGLNRTHKGFRTKALSSVARLLQEPEGRSLVGAVNQGGKSSASHVTIAPVSNTAHVITPGFLGRGPSGTIAPAGWDAEALDQKKNALLSGTRLKAGRLHNLDKAGNPLSAFEHAAAHQHERDGKKGVVLGGEKFAFNTGTGSRIGYIAEHRDSENRVVTHAPNGDWREGLSPTSVALGHELGHALRNRRGANIDSAFSPKLLTHVGVDPEEHQQWSNTDEELVNIRQVENKLLVEKDLAPRDFHKDYDEAIIERLYVRCDEYRNGIGYNPAIYKKLQTAMANKNYAQANETLTRQGY